MAPQPVGQSRIVIDDVRPRTPTGEYPAKAAVGETVSVSADIFRDGHNQLAARARWRRKGRRNWQTAPMQHVVNDRWEGTFAVEEVGAHEFVVEAWTDLFGTWRHDVQIKAGAGQPVELELEEGAILLRRLADAVAEDRRPLVAEAAEAVCRIDCSTQVRLNAALDDAVAAAVEGTCISDDSTPTSTRGLWVDREIGVCGAWYEFFPRSEGGLLGALKRLPDVADMGFDIVYFPPIHPIGHTYRKGANNTLVAGSDDPGSPWAIGGEEGGHTAIHPELGTIDDFDRLVEEAGRLGLEVALDYALQCSPDHPWVREHPEWFHHRPDGSIKYAENPPKKYQDIYPINFWPERDEDRIALWKACKEIFDYWISHGVRIFRVDNPHTKPMAFWEWVLAAVQAEHPGIAFLSEAFTRPKVMAKLAEVGFTQSYTYFTWRTSKQELASYVSELAHTELADYMRPNFWPNTPDILSGPLRYGNRAAFELRLVLAATLVPSYGVYSGYELCENVPASEANEEYLNSEKFEVKDRDWAQAGTLTRLVTKINEIRRRHRPAIARLRNVRFHHSNNDALLVYSRASDDGSDVLLCVVNLDPHTAHDDVLWIDLDAVGVSSSGSYEAHDELTGVTYRWEGPHPYVRLDPGADQVAHIFHLRAP